MVPSPPPINDPFAQLDGQRTFIKPNPGGGWGGPPRSADTGAMVADAAVGEPVNAEQGLNPLLAVANKLLLLFPQLRRTRQVADPGALRAALAQGVRDFEATAHQRGIPPERVMAARSKAKSCQTRSPGCQRRPVKPTQARKLGVPAASSRSCSARKTRKPLDGVRAAG